MKCECGDQASKWIEDNGVNIPKCKECFEEMTTGVVPQPYRPKWYGPVNSLRELERGDDDEQDE
jgi:hypothetical protein